jgi:hypothetical protein
MNLPRFRIAWLMVAVAIAALDFGAIRALDYPQGGRVLMLGALPMANVLMASLLACYVCAEDRAFYVGFAFVGTTALASSIALATSSPGPKGAIGSYVGVLFSFLPQMETVSNDELLVLVPIILCGFLLMLGGPQLAIALIGGLLFRRYKITRH